MIVMKRYCDYDYDQNCIVLFDAAKSDVDDDDEKHGDLNIFWISDEAPQEEPNKPNKSIPFRQYLEMIQNQRKQTESSATSSNTQPKHQKNLMVQQGLIPNQKYLSNCTSKINKLNQKIAKMSKLKKLNQKRVKPIRQPCQIIYQANKNVFVQQTNVKYTLPDSPYYNFRRVQMQHNN
eukprot:UN11110